MVVGRRKNFVSGVETFEFEVGSGKSFEKVMSLKFTKRDLHRV